MSDAKKPAAKINLFPVSAAIWRNETAKSVHYSVTFEKSYKDDSGKWQTSSSFLESDLLLLAKAADLAHDKIQEQHGFDRSAAAYVAEAS